MTQTILSIIFILSFLGYFWTNKREYKYTFETFFDQKIKIIPIFVIPYVLMFPLIFFTYIEVFNTQFLNSFLISVSTANVMATLFWFLFPNGVKRSFVEDKGLFQSLINYIYKHDGDTNGFPSGHVFLSLISTYFLCLVASNLTILWVIVGTLISLSTVFTKQHYVVDIFGGIIFTILPVIIAFQII